MMIIISSFFIVFELCFLVKKRFEELLPPVAITAVIIGYCLAIFQKLHWFPWVALAIAAAGLLLCLWSLREKKEANRFRRFIDNALTPGWLCFLLLACFFWLTAMPRAVTHTDEVYVWGLQPLSLYYRSGFVDSALHLSPRFMNYMPGMHIFQWIGLAAYGEWNEGILFVWLWLFYLIMLLPLTCGITWKKPGWLPVFLAAAWVLPVAFSPEAYQILRVDTALGLCLGYAAIQAWRFAHEGENRCFYGITLALGLMVLVLVKQPGIGWALLPLLLVLVAGADSQSWKKRIKDAALIALAPLLTYGSWTLFCQALGLRGMHTDLLTTQSKMITQGQLTVSPADLRALFAAILSFLGRGSFSLEDRVLQLPPATWMAVFLLFPIGLYFTQKMKKQTMRRLVLMLLSGYVLYIGIFYAALLTVFRPEWQTPVDQAAIAPLIGNFHRYGSTLWYALLMLFSHVCLSPENSPLHQPQVPKSTKPSPRWRAMVCCLFAAILLNIHWPAFLEAFFPEEQSATTLSEGLESIAVNSIWADEIEQPEDAIVFFAADSYPHNRDWIQYALAPTKIVLSFQTDVSLQDFHQFLQDHHIQYFVSEGTENEFYPLAAESTADGYLEAYELYRVEMDGAEPRLVSIYE